MFISISFLLICLLNISLAQDADLKKAMESHEVIPDVIAEAPIQSLKVTYDDDVVVNNGNELKPVQVKNEPSAFWEPEADAFYTLMMISPDSPSRAKPSLRDLVHWIVGNIPGNDISKGDVIVEYIGAGPPEGTGLHRYVILVYKQPAKITFDEERIPKTSPKGRFQYSTNKFLQKYNLGSPIAGNFFQALFDDYTPLLHQRLGLNFDKN